MTPLETYLRELRGIRSTGAGVEEESYYHPLAALLNEVGKKLKPRVKCVLQLANRGAGKPDGGLFTADQFEHLSDAEPLPGQLPARGAIEVKPTKDDAWVTAEAKQVTKYWNRYRQVLVTNYRDFVLVGQDAESNPAILETYRLAESDKAFWQAAASPRSTAEKQNDRFVEYLQRVMRHGAAIAAPEDVAWFLASYARDALAGIRDVELSALGAVRAALEEALGLKFEGEKGEHFFRSSLVQTLFYGIFSAWVLWAKQRSAGILPASQQDAGATTLLPASQQDAGATTRFDWYTTARYLRVPMISKLFHLVADPQELEALKLTEVLDWATLVLNRVDRRSFFDKFQESHAVQYFYEPFLEAFDPELRKELGVWYTPPEVVKYMVERVDTVLREELKLPEGLADKNVYVLDPCCGTGSYLVEVLDRIHRTLKERGDDALTASDLKEAAQRRVFGFEILPAPFVVSHLQLGLLLQNLGAPLSVAPASSRQTRRDGGATHGPERVGVYLTNALTGWEPPKEPKARLLFPELEDERDAAEHVKLDVPILVILGNPPYNSFAGIARMDEERDLSEAYRTTKKAPAPQGQGLNDLYVRFFRMAERGIVEKTGRGVVCLISNYSWLDGLSFTGMRERYLEAFDRIWIDCLNGDKYKTGKLTPEGEPDPSIFSTELNREGIQVGTAITLLVCSAVRSAGFQPAPEQTQQPAGVTIPNFRYEAVATRGRGYLPHWEMEGATYFVTFRLVDSLPPEVIESYRFETKDLVKTAEHLGRELTKSERKHLHELFTEKIEAALDAGAGPCHLAKPEIADMVAGALRYFDGQRYDLVAWSVMPNHVHVVFQPHPDHPLAEILHSWKSFTSNQANKILGGAGQFWEREYYDHLVRDVEELERIIRYVVENPRQAKLQNWPWVWARSTAVSAADKERQSSATVWVAQGRQDVARGRQDAGATNVTAVRFRHLWGKTKRQQLLESAAQDGQSLYQQLEPPLELGLPFAPAQVGSGYLAWPLLPDLFPISFPGVKTSRDDVVVDIDRERLIERMRLYFDPRVSHEEMRRISPSVMTNTARFKAEAVRDYLRKRGFLEKNVVRYCYRPFDARWLYWEGETKLLDEKRIEYFPHVFAGNGFMFTTGRTRKSLIEPALFCCTLCDLNSMDSGARGFPLYLDSASQHRSLIPGYPPSGAVALREGARPNASESLIRYIGKVPTGGETASPFYHTIAILHSRAYRNEHIAGLRSNWPRIPLPDSKELLLASAALGRKLAALLDTETPFDVAPASRRQEMKAIETPAIEQEPPGWWRYIGVPTRVDSKPLDETRDLAVTAGWGHAGKGGVTMPGKGRLIERDYTPEELAGSAAVSAAKEEKSQQDAGATGGAGAMLLGDRTCDVYLNDVAYWKNIPLRVWEYTIGGYQVIKKWLSYREEKLLGRPMTKEEVRWVQEMARRIAAILLLEPALDENYRAVKAHAYDWPRKA